MFKLTTYIYFLLFAFLGPCLLVETTPLRRVYAVFLYMDLELWIFLNWHCPMIWWGWRQTNLVCRGNNITHLQEYCKSSFFNFMICFGFVRWRYILLAQALFWEKVLKVKRNLRPKNTRTTSENKNKLWAKNNFSVMHIVIQFDVCQPQTLIHLFGNYLSCVWYEVRTPKCISHYLPRRITVTSNLKLSLPVMCSTTPVLT